MQVVIVHLSDIHLDESGLPSGRAATVGRAVKALESEAKACIVILSGDIAYSGKENQYKKASDFVVDLETELVRERNWEILSVAVPGNHDCDFARDSQARQLLIDRIRSSALDVVEDSTVRLCTGIQAAFFDFADAISKRATQTRTDWLSWDTLATLTNVQLHIRCFNTAWMSTLTEDQGGLVFPVGSTSCVPSEADLSIAVLHHPFNWFDSRNARLLKECVEKHADIILTGHEHTSDSFEMSRDGADPKTYISGGICQ